MTPCETPCPKCGSLDILRRFHKKNAVIETSTYDERPLPAWVGGEAYKFWATRDLIHHHCRTCQFAWVDKPLTKPRPQKPAPASGEADEA
jgi:hypothetical protein